MSKICNGSVIKNGATVVLLLGRSNIFHCTMHAFCLVGFSSVTVFILLIMDGCICLFGELLCLMWIVLCVLLLFFLTFLRFLIHKGPDGHQSLQFCVKLEFPLLLFIFNFEYYF